MASKQISFFTSFRITRQHYKFNTYMLCYAPYIYSIVAIYISAYDGYTA